MLTFPRRLNALIERLEAGQDVTPEEARRLALLQALDVAVIGEEFVRAAVSREERRTDEFRAE